MKQRPADSASKPAKTLPLKMAGTLSLVCTFGLMLTAVETQGAGPAPGPSPVPSKRSAADRCGNAPSGPSADMYNQMAWHACKNPENAKLIQARAKKLRQESRQ
jgi:hypothetical protein